jgi:hypothetical protein
MSTKTLDKTGLGTIATVLAENISDAEMDRLLAERHDEIEGLLAEAREARARGEFAALDPLYVFLRRARERYEAKH